MEIATEKRICQLCNENEVESEMEGAKVCDACKAAPKYPLETVQDAKELKCASCGGPFEPYQNGKYRVTNPASGCKTCLMKKKYGEDWFPGRKPDKEKRAAVQRRYMEKKKKKMIEDLIPPAPHVYPMPEGHIWKDEDPDRHVLVTFSGTDKAMYERLKAIATKERRCMEQQILFYLDKALTEGVEQ